MMFGPTILTAHPNIFYSDSQCFFHEPAGWGLGRNAPCVPQTPVATPLVVHMERNHYQKLLFKLDCLADVVCAPTSQAQVTKTALGGVLYTAGHEQLCSPAQLLARWRSQMVFVGRCFL